MQHRWRVLSTSLYLSSYNMDCLGVLNPETLNPLNGFPEITVRIENYISILHVQSIFLLL
jgi:hypothetical protein